MSARHAAHPSRSEVGTRPHCSRCWSSARRQRSREAIAADLWPEADATSAAMLRQALWLVRHGLGRAGVDPAAILDIRPESIGIRADARLEIDVVAFERCLDDGGCGAEHAVELYRGDLLESLGHECFAAERERLADRYEDALVTVAQHRLTDGDLAGARRAAEEVDRPRPDPRGGARHPHRGPRTDRLARPGGPPVPAAPGRPRPRTRRTAASRDRRRVPPGHAPRRPTVDGAGRPAPRPSSGRRWSRSGPDATVDRPVASHFGATGLRCRTWPRILAIGRLTLVVALGLAVAACSASGGGGVAIGIDPARTVLLASTDGRPDRRHP